MKIVSAAEMREIDRVTSEKFGVPSLTLMENAGAAVAERVVSLLDGSAGTPAAKACAGARRTKASIAAFEEKIVVLCGLGNNGGDGFVDCYSRSSGW